MKYEYQTKKINGEQLFQEAGIDGITSVGLTTKGERMWFTFEKPLSAGDKTKLDNAITNHVASPIVKADPIMDKLNEILTKLNQLGV